MAGKGQHFIPRWFLKGFVTPDGNDKLWHYRKDSSSSFPRSRGETAKQHNFYSKPADDGSSSLDDVITAEEAAFASKLKALCEAEIGSTLAPSEAAELLAHLAVRNRHTRTIFADALDQMLRAFMSPAFDLEGVLGIRQRTPPPELGKAIEDDQFAQNIASASGIQMATYVRIAHFLLREQFTDAVTLWQSEFFPVLDELRGRSPSLAARGHREALTKSHTPSAHVQNLERLSWTVEEAPAGGAVLPDCVVLGLTADGEWVPYILGETKAYQAVIAPLTKDRILVGRAPDLKSLDLSTFNDWAAAASHEVFFSHRTGNDLDTLHSTIGVNSTRILEGYVSEAVSGVGQGQGAEEIGGRTSQSSATIEVGEPNEQADSAPQPISFKVNFPDWCDKETAQRIAEQVKIIVTSFSKLLRIDRVDDITFAADYKGALRSLDRGFEASRPLEPAEGDHGVSIGMAPPVLRDGILKWRIVTHASVGNDLLSDDEKACRDATGIIWSLLAHVAFEQLIGETLPGFLMNPLADTYEGALYAYSQGALGAYFSGWLSAVFNDDSLEQSAESLATLANQAHEAISEGRNTLGQHNNIEALFHEAGTALGQILSMSARILGCMDGNATESQGINALRKSLDDYGLGNWIDLFHTDLRYLFDRAGRWSSFEELLIVNRHLERLFWAFGILPEHLPPDSIYVHFFPEVSGGKSLASVFLR